MDPFDTLQKIATENRISIGRLAPYLQKTRSEISDQETNYSDRIKSAKRLYLLYRFTVLVFPYMTSTVSNLFSKDRTTLLQLLPDWSNKLTYDKISDERIYPRELQIFQNSDMFQSIHSQTRDDRVLTTGPFRDSSQFGSLNPSVMFSEHPINVLIDE